MKQHETLKSDRPYVRGSLPQNIEPTLAAAVGRELDRVEAGFANMQDQITELKQLLSAVIAKLP